MVTEIRQSSNNTVWVVVAIVAVIAIIAIAFMAMSSPDQTADVEVIPPIATPVISPPTTVVDLGGAAADSAASAARAAESAAASAGQAAQNAANATADRVTIAPGPGDSTVTVTTPR